MSAPLLAIAGPTGVGKSALGLHLARVFGDEIVSADSRTVLTIGTDTRPFWAREGIPHHLFALVDPDGSFSLADYQAAATAVITAIHARG